MNIVIAIFLLVSIPQTLACTPTRDKHGKIARSRTVLNHFKKLHPCPATGFSVGTCKGWVIDHVEPLACCGQDAVENLQWQTSADAREKDKIERKFCGSFD